MSRGGAPATSWATYSTALGSPVGDTTGGTFRFTCSTAKAPCVIDVTAKVTGSDHLLQPRLLIYRQGDGTGGGTLDEQYCEYLDGTFPNVTSAGVSVPMSAGSTFDCGSAETQINAPSADLQVASYVVGPGYYDVHSTFRFLP